MKPPAAQLPTKRSHRSGERDVRTGLGPEAISEALIDNLKYLQARRRVSDAYQDQRDWTRRSILNAARCGRFSSDRAIREHCRDIWHTTPLPGGGA